MIGRKDTGKQAGEPATQSDRVILEIGEREREKGRTTTRIYQQNAIQRRSGEPGRQKNPKLEDMAQLTNRT